MSRKRNEYLDISDEEDAIVSEEEQEQGRSAKFGQPASKRRKLSIDSRKSSEEDVQEEEEEDAPEEDVALDHATIGSRETPKTKTASLLKSSTSHQRKRAKTGVVYLSRIPPFMKPTALRHLLEPYGTLLRIFLTPEPSPAYLKRKKSGGNKKRSFIDGWVEFASKKKAKICAEVLNGNIIGGKKSGWYHDDIWNIRYLKGFKWDDLMQQVQDEERARESKLRADLEQETKERKAFLENVEREQIEKTRESKRKKRGETSREGATMDDQRPTVTQNKVKQKDNTSTMEEPQDQVKRVLSKIF